MAFALVLIVLGTVAAVLYGGGATARFADISRAASERLELYHQIAGMILRRPLLGYGAGSFEQAFSLFHAPPVDVSAVWDHAHSTYLTLWSDFGLVVGTVPMAIVLLLLIHALRLPPGSPATAAIGTTVVVGLHSLVDFSLEVEAIAFLLTTVLGTAWASSGSTGNSPAKRFDRKLH